MSLACTRGRPEAKRDHVAPRSCDHHTPSSLPTYRMSSLFPTPRTSSSNEYVGTSGRFPPMFVQLAPPLLVRQTWPVESKRPTTAYAVSASVGSTTMSLMRFVVGGVRACQVAPWLVVTNSAVVVPSTDA